MAIAKQFVREKYPNAIEEPYCPFANVKAWVICDGQIVLGDGRTKISAWENAKKRIQEDDAHNKLKAQE